MKRLLSILPLALMTVWHAEAGAQVLADPYVSVNVGVTFPPDQDIDGSFGDDTLPIFDRFGGEIEFDSGFLGTVVVGSKRTGLGVELEGFYQALNLGDVALNFDTQADRIFVGDGSVFGGLVNLVYAFGDDNNRWLPRLGAGVGYSHITFDIDEAFDDGDSALAYQVFAGLGYAINERLDLQTIVRYLGMSNVTLNDSDFDTDAQFDTFAATVGFSWRW